MRYQSDLWESSWARDYRYTFVSADHILLLGGGRYRAISEGLSWGKIKAEIYRPTEGGGNARAISEGMIRLKFDRLTEWPVGWLGWLSVRLTDRLVSWFPKHRKFPNPQSLAPRLEVP